MSGPVYGGDSSLNEGSESKYKGLYAEHPAFTPKFNASASLESTQTTQARMYIPVPTEALFKQIKNALPEQAKPYADAFVQRGPQFAGRIYVDFVLQGVQESFQEKVQVTEVLSDAYIAYFFGQRAPTWSYTGIVLNTQQNQWYDAWHIVYSSLLRGSKTASFKVPVVLAYDTRRVVGSILATSTSLRANNETFAQLSFSMLVKRVQYLPEAGARASNFSVPASRLLTESDIQTKQLTSQTDTIKEQRLTDEQIQTLVTLSAYSPLSQLIGESNLVDGVAQPAAEAAANRASPQNTAIQATIGGVDDVRTGADPLVLRERFGAQNTTQLSLSTMRITEVEQVPNRERPGGTGPNAAISEDF